MTKAITSLFTLVFSICSFAQSGSKSLMYEISGNGLEKPSYIYGTIHIIPKKDFFLDDIVKEKIAECEVMTFEIDIFGMTLKQKVDLAKDLVLKDGKKLNDYLDKEVYDGLVQFARDSLGVKEKKFEINNIYDQLAEVDYVSPNVPLPHGTCMSDSSWR